ncbi:MAG TPA: anaerobic ribonucleoside-triphosphate reductase, partial [Candidatus Omnitrophota bacterium]|nr:anaerobic ribonucleoside-triphosphate reductase [Candidatus Omnitrophota bacterium]
AIGPGGEYTGKTYKEYKKESQAFARAMFDIYAEGDGAGRPFFFPKPLLHLTEKFFTEEGHQDFLRLASDVAAKMGNTYFVFDRGETAKISECCRLAFKLEYSDLQDAKEPWRMRYSAIQNITVNLPRIAYLAEGDEERLLKLLEARLELAARAHKQKRIFIEKLLAEGTDGPLSLLAMKRDGEAYLRLRRVTHLVGILGLNEMVEAQTGSQLHESPEALKLGLKVVSFMRIKCEELSEKFDLRFVLEQTPAESTAYRFAKLDLQHFPVNTIKVVKGSLENGEIYYTNSTYFNVNNNMSPIDRVKQEGLFHPLIDAGALTHIWLGESRPSAESIANFVVKVFRETQSSQVAFSPEFTVCNDCGRTDRGLKDRCPFCRSDRVEGITRITGYFSRVSGWNKGKVAELRDRSRSDEGSIN